MSARHPAVATYGAVQDMVPDFMAANQAAIERLQESGAARWEAESREYEAKFELMVTQGLSISGKDKDTVQRILTDVLCEDGNGDMARLILRAALTGNVIHLKGLGQAWLEQAGQIYADGEMSK